MWKKSDFQIIELLGKGMFAEVYKAKELKSNKTVAIKIIKKSLIKKYKLTNNLRREIEIQSHINYKHILKLFGYFTDKKNIYLILEYIKKGTLYEILKKDSKFFNIENIRKISKQLAMAIKYMNLRHVIHRDIKMENILIDEDLNLKLGDFGWSVHSPNNNVRNTFCGTYAYLAPELCRKKNYSGKVDIWAFGILLFEMFFKKTPFLSKDENKIQDKIIFDKLKFPFFIDNTARELIRGCLEKDEKKRWDIDQILKSRFYSKMNK